MSSNTSERISQLSPLKQALLKIEEMQSKLNAIERAKSEPIAIIGMGCRFPGGVNDPETYWQLLKDGREGIVEVPSDRWNVNAYYDPDPNAPGKMYTRYGGFMEGVDGFDPQFFRISPREAVGIDPQQRLLLEVCWEALEHAGQVPEQLRGSPTGVFVGTCFDDYAELSVFSGDPTRIDAYTSLGNFRSVAAGRIAYIFGLQGPTLQLDTACASSLVAVHLACQSLRSRESNLALAGGVNLMISPGTTIGFSKLKALAPDGKCKTFDASADGYSRGEGCGIVVLKRLSDALADGDNILAVIRGTAVNHDGPSSGLTVPNQQAQEELIRQALRNGKVNPLEINYIEAHGTGTVLGDPIEVEALASVLCEGRDPEQPLTIGSVKTNIGHLEAAAGVAGLIKVVLSLQNQAIPPHLHFHKPNPHIQWQEIPVRVPTQLTPWPTGEKPRLAGVSSFGMSGTNAHIVLEEAPSAEPLPASVERPLHLLTLSAKTPEALKELASRYENYLTAHETVTLGDICFSANTGRSHFQHRLSAIASSPAQLYQQLAAFSTLQEVTEIVQGQVKDTIAPQIAFLFTGQGSQYVDMGRQLYETQPTFRQALDRCDEILRPYLEKPLLQVLYPAPGENSPLNQTAYTQPALFALEYALYQLWKSWGITPQVVMGHSVGEYVAATVAGVFSLEDGLKLIAARGRLMQALPTDGEMVALLASEAQVAQVIQPYLQEVSIAAINGPESVVISGKSQVVRLVVAQLEAMGIKATALQVSHAFHSPSMEPMLADFEQIAQEVTYSSPSIDLVSNITGQLIKGEIATPDYWLNHVRQPVRFAQGIETLDQQGYEIFVEIGPKPILLGMGRQCLPDAAAKDGQPSLKWLPSLRPGQSDWQQILQSLAKLYVHGVAVNWTGFDQDYSRYRVLLPTYPFQRQRYWVETTTSDAYQRVTFSQKEEADTDLPNNSLTKKGNLDREQLLAAEPAESKEILENYLRKQIAKVLLLSTSNLDLEQPLNRLGLDSLMSAEISKKIEANFGISVSVVQLLEGLNIAQLATQVLQQLTVDSPTPSLPPLLRNEQTLDNYPLSFVQERFWFLNQLENGHPVHNIPIAISLTGQLNISTLEQSLNEIVKRHATLRTYFAALNGNSSQRVTPTLTLTIPVVELQSVALNQQESEVLRLATIEAQQPFDLMQAPLWRTTLLKLGQEKHILLITMHHIVSDILSLGVFVQEIATLYDAFIANKQSPLSELSVQYTDFVHWQKQWLQGEVLEPSLAYWKQKLKDAPAVLQLPTDHPRPERQSLQGASQFFELSSNLTAALRALSRQEGSTLFMTLLAAFKTLLYRYSGQEDILVGSPIAGRIHPKTENLIGLFTDTLVLRTDLSNNPSFRELLSRVKAVTLEAYTHQNVPLTKVVEVAQRQRSNSNKPLFQVVFNFLQQPPTDMHLGNLNWSPLNVDRKMAEFDFFMIMYVKSDKLYGGLEYNTDLFEASTISRMVRHFETLLQGIVDSPDIGIAQLPLMTMTEQIKATKTVELPVELKARLADKLKNKRQNDKNSKTQ